MAYNTIDFMFMAQCSLTVQNRGLNNNNHFLSELQRERTEQLRIEFLAEQEDLKNEFDSERRKMVEQHSQEMGELQDVMFAMEQNFNEKESDAKSEFQSMRDEIKNKVRWIFLQVSMSIPSPCCIHVSLQQPWQFYTCFSFNLLIYEYILKSHVISEYLKQGISL